MKIVLNYIAMFVATVYFATNYSFPQPVPDRTVRWQRHTCMSYLPNMIRILWHL